MSSNRRSFLKRMSVLGLGASVSNVPLQLFTEKYDIEKITILHTNDVHSRVEPFPLDGGKFQGLGGAARRATIIQQIRKEEKNVWLLDAGDIFQGTPYFNVFHGEVEMKLMKAMAYDAATIGNHDFDEGIEMLAKQLPVGGFSMLNCNYKLENTPLQKHVLPYKIFKKNGIKIGVLGLGIELQGLVPAKCYGEIQYENPVEKANYYADILKNDYKCNLVICLSHLGLKYETDALKNKITDMKLAQLSRNIDVIIGGHTHTLLPEPIFIQNSENKSVAINQVGWAGIALGRLDFYFEKNSFSKKCISCKPVIISN